MALALPALQHFNCIRVGATGLAGQPGCKEAASGEVCSGVGIGAILFPWPLTLNTDTLDSRAGVDVVLHLLPLPLKDGKLAKDSCQGLSFDSQVSTKQKGLPLL